MMNEKKKAQLDKVRELAAALGVEILAHFYQREEVKAAAAFVGGSGEVVSRAVQSRAPAVMLCGASFMAEELRRLGPQADLLVPRNDLSCPLAEAVTMEELLAARREHPEALLLADMKVRPELRDLADMLISPNTVRERLAGVPDRSFIVLPGAQLLDWAGLGQRVLQRWPKAVCQVHELALPEELAEARAEHPEAKVAVNLLCRPDLWPQADFVGDSAGIRDYCLASPAKEFIIVSEAGLAEYLSQSCPGKVFHETAAEIFCPNMKLTTLKTMIARLEQYAADRQP